MLLLALFLLFTNMFHNAKFLFCEILELIFFHGNQELTLYQSLWYEKKEKEMQKRKG